MTVQRISVEFYTEAPEMINGWPPVVEAALSLAVYNSIYGEISISPTRRKFIGRTWLIFHVIYENRNGMQTDCFMLCDQPLPDYFHFYKLI